MRIIETEGSLNVAASSTPLLLVDDDVSRAVAIVGALAGARPSTAVSTASTLAALHEALAAGGPQIALVSFSLVDGQPVEALRDEIRTASFPVVLMVGKGDERAAEAATSLGVFDYVVATPGALEELPHTVERTLRFWRLGHEHAGGRRDRGAAHPRTRDC